MAPTDTTDRTTFWQDHVTTWQASDLMEWSAPLPKRPQMGHDVSSNQTSEQKGDRP